MPSRALINPTGGFFLPSRNYMGSSGYWAGDNSQRGGGLYDPSLGYPGDVALSQLGYPQVTAPAWARGGGSSVLPGHSYGLGGSVSPADPSLVSQVKSPGFQNAIDTGLSDLTGTRFNPAVNPNVVRTNVKNPALDAAIAGMTSAINSASNPTQFTKSGQYQAGINAGFQQASKDQQRNREQFDQFAQMFSANTPKAESNVSQENSSIDQIYNGGVQSQLDKIAQQRASAVNLAAQRALGTVGRNNALLRMGMGDSSYANKQALDAAANIYAQEAIAQSDLARQNYTDVLGMQAAMLGRRNVGLDYLSQRQLVPVEALNQLGMSENARLAQLGGMDLTNNIYTTPAEQAQQRAMILSQLANLDNTNRFYSLDNPQSELARRAAILGQFNAYNQSNNFYGLKQNTNTSPYGLDTNSFGAYSVTGGPGTGYGNYRSPAGGYPTVSNYGGAGVTAPDPALQPTAAAAAAKGLGYGILGGGTLNPAAVAASMNQFGLGSGGWGTQPFRDYRTRGVGGMSNAGYFPEIGAYVDKTTGDVLGYTPSSPYWDKYGPTALPEGYQGPASPYPW